MTPQERLRKIIDHRNKLVAKAPMQTGRRTPGELAGTAAIARGQALLRAKRPKLAKTS